MYSFSPEILFSLGLISKGKKHDHDTDSTGVATLNVKTTLNVKNSYTKGKFVH